MAEDDAESVLRKWATDDPQRVIGRGHPVSDFLEARAGTVLERAPGALRVRATLPVRVINLKGVLFGGFTPTDVDFFGLFVFHSLRAPDAPRRWLNTTRLDVEYFAPSPGPEIEIAGSLLHRRGRSAHIEVRFENGDALCALARLSLLESRP